MSVEGYVMDQFCLDLGVLMDNPSIRFLEEPDQHSIHCLVDIKSCINSNFVVLADPANGGDTEYSPAYMLDDATKTTIVQLAKDNGSCKTCVNGYDESMLQMGLRASVLMAKITAEAMTAVNGIIMPATIMATSDIVLATAATDGTTENENAGGVAAVVGGGDTSAAVPVGTIRGTVGMAILGLWFFVADTIVA